LSSRTAGVATGFTIAAPHGLLYAVAMTEDAVARRTTKPQPNVIADVLGSKTTQTF
jgi:hypothetical protein